MKMQKLDLVGAVTEAGCYGNVSQKLGWGAAGDIVIAARLTFASRSDSINEHRATLRDVALRR